MDRLDTLTLNHNYLQELGPGGFEGLSKLTSLSLDYNKIATIDPEAFKGLEGTILTLMGFIVPEISQFPGALNYFF